MKKLVLVIPFLALVAAVYIMPRAAIAQNTMSAKEKGDYTTVQLLRLMDKDKNGKVSRAEFMKFMNGEFDRLDINKDGELDVTELSHLHLHYLRGTSK
jgi:Ca2+-binding EF-hand superfamily protein